MCASCCLLPATTLFAGNLLFFRSFDLLLGDNHFHFFFSWKYCSTPELFMNSIIHARMEVKYAFKMEILHLSITNKRTIQLHDHKYYFMISNSNSHLKTKLRPNSSTSYNIEHRRARQPLKEPRKQTYSMVSPSGEKPLSIISMWTTEACHISGVEKRTEKTLLLKLAAENQTRALSQLSNSYTFFGHNAVAIFFFFSFSFNNTLVRYEEKTSKWPLN